MDTAMKEYRHRSAEEIAAVQDAYFGKAVKTGCARNPEIALKGESMALEWLREREAQLPGVADRVAAWLSQGQWDIFRCVRLLYLEANPHDIQRANQFLQLSQLISTNFYETAQISAVKTDEVIVLQAAPLSEAEIESRIAVLRQKIEDQARARR